jgi:signal transduction histidine kinase
MRDSALSPEERRQYLEIAIRHCVHLSRLVAGLFDLAKLEARETAVVREPFNISELVQDAVQKYGLAGRERGVLLRTNAGENIPFVFADIALIGRVLDNLVENAIRHTPKGGAVDVDLAAGNDAVAVTVSDTGTGIAADELPHIFDRFYRGGARRMDEDGHAGLGLAIVKKILELHGSTVDVRSVPGKGAAFAFSLPMYRPSS